MNQQIGISVKKRLLEASVQFGLIPLKRPSDGRGKMSVDGGCKTVVVKVGLSDSATAKIDCLHHAAGCQDAQHRIHVRVSWLHSGVQRGGERLVALHIQREALFKKFKALVNWIT